MWGMPYPAAYLPLYNASAVALKAVHPALQVGGPSSANLEHVADLIADTIKAQIPLDFISSHHYPSDPSCSRAGGGKNTMNANCFSLDVLESATIAKEAALPYFLSEYKDGLQGGPGTGFGVSWWTFSDVFEENWMIGLPFYGGYAGRPLGCHLIALWDAI